MGQSSAQRMAARRKRLAREGARQYLVTLPAAAAKRLEHLRRGRTVSETVAALVNNNPLPDE